MQSTEPEKLAPENFRKDSESSKKTTLDVVPDDQVNKSDNVLETAPANTSEAPSEISETSDDPIEKSVLDPKKSKLDSSMPSDEQVAPFQPNEEPDHDQN
jgi:hypothetical protein